MTDLEFGRRWDSRLPRFDIRWLIARLHVSETEAAVEENIRKRVGDKWPVGLADEAVAYAIECHRSNQNLFHMVQTGRF